MAGARVVFRAAASLALLAAAAGEFYDTFTGRQMSPAKYREYQRLNLVPYCAIEVQPCNENEPRRLDYTCNNLHHPSRGATLTPYRRMLPPMFDANSNHRPSSSGAPLPNARAARTAVMSDGRVESKTYTQLVPNGAVFITGDITSVHDTVNYVAVTRTCCTSGQADPRCMPIRVPDDDVHLRYSNVRCLNLTKVITYQTLGCAPNTLPPERINTSPPMLEMSIIYGHDEKSARQGREGSGGRLKQETQNGAVYPPGGSTFCMQNQRPEESRCHNTPSSATNALIGSNMMSIWFWRNHNNIARHLEAMNPCWSDERLFFEAREVNIAMMNQIWYYELMPTIIGYDYLLKSKAIFDTSGHVNDYDPTLEPRVSIEYVIGSRWFHSMQEGRLKTYDTKGRLLNELKAVELSLRTGVLPNNRTLQGLTQGAFRQPAAETDHLIDPDMGERVLGGLQAVSDVASSDIMKSREAGLPPYNHYRKLCGLPVAKDFDDLKGWMYQEQIDGLKLTYEDVDDIDFMVGIMAEKRMRGAAVGPTLACVMTDQLVWWRRADRFWYENSVHPGAFTEEQLQEIRQTTLSRLICDNGDEVDKIQPFAFVVPRDDNELVDCKLLRAPRLDPWRDEQCQDNNKFQLQQNILNSKQQFLNIQNIAYNQQALDPLLQRQNQQQLNTKQQNANNQNIGSSKNQQTDSFTPSQNSLNKQLLTNAIPSKNTIWDANDMNVLNVVNNWSPGYMQDLRWGQGFWITQSPVTNNQGEKNNQGNQGVVNNKNNLPSMGTNGVPVVNNGLKNIPTGVNTPKNMPQGVNAPSNIPQGVNAPNTPSIVNPGGSSNMLPGDWPNNMPLNANWPKNVPANANWPSNIPTDLNWQKNMPAVGGWLNMPAGVIMPTGVFMPTGVNAPSNMPQGINGPNNMPQGANGSDNEPNNTLQGVNDPNKMPQSANTPSDMSSSVNTTSEMPSSVNTPAKDSNTSNNLSNRNNSTTSSNKTPSNMTSNTATTSNSNPATTNSPVVASSMTATTPDNTPPTNVMPIRRP